MYRLNGNKYFTRRQGVNADQGINYERGVTIATFLRCHKLYKSGDIKSFNEANNLAGVGSLDDVVLGIEYEEGGEAKKRLVFVQTKHVDNVARKRTIKEIFTKKKNLC
jgi:hypothetical protein